MDKILKFFEKIVKNKNLKYSTITVVMICIAAAIAIVVNMIVGMANVKWDMTPNKLYTIGDITKEILAGLDKDVVIYGLFDEEKLTSDDGYKDVVYLLEQYDRYPRVSVVYVDLEKNPSFLAEIDPDNVMDLGQRQFVVQCGNKKRKLEMSDLFIMRSMDQFGFDIRLTGSDAEQGFTGAIKYVIADVTPTIYYTQGHGEPLMDRGYQFVKEFLERNNYDVKPIDLLAEEKVPEDAAVLLVISPTKDITIEERNKLEDYLYDGGRAMFLLDPVEGNVSFSEFNKLLSEFNVAVNSDIISENNKGMHVAGNQRFLIPRILPNPVNKDLNTENFRMLMPNARSIEILKNVKEYIEVIPLAVTSSQADSFSTIDAQEEKRTGEYDLAVAVYYTGGFEPAKLVVAGNSFFMSDYVYQMYGPNALSGVSFFINSLYWLHDEADDLYIPPKYYESQGISITDMERIFGMILISVVPLLILGAGAFVYLRRRHL